MEPVYLSTIIIGWSFASFLAAVINFLITGDNFKFGHISRALYHRLDRTGDEAEMCLPTIFQAICPQILHSELCALIFETEKSTSQTAIWTLGQKKAEVIDGTTGKLIDE
jgi:hypothetical protein